MSILHTSRMTILPTFWGVHLSYTPAARFACTMTKNSHSLYFLSNLKNKKPKKWSRIVRPETWGSNLVSDK